MAGSTHHNRGTLQVLIAAALLLFLLTPKLRIATRRLMLALFVACAVQTPAIAATPEPSTAVALDPALPYIDLTGRVGVLVDQEQRLTIDAVRAYPTRDRFETPQQTSNDLNFGFSDAIYWLRIDVVTPALTSADAGTTTDTQWLLEIAYPPLDWAALYIGDAAEPIVTGDRQPFSEHPYPHRNLVFPLQLEAGQPTTLWLQVQSVGTLTIPLSLWRHDAFAEHNQRSYAVLALYYGISVTLLLYNLLLYFAIRKRSYLEYTLCTLGMIIGQLTLNGFGNQFVWPEATWWGHVALPFGMAIGGLFGALFTRSFLGTRKAAPRLDKVLTVIALAYMLTAIATLALPYRYGATAVALLGPLFACTALLCGLHCARQHHPQARIYLMAWAALLIGAAILGMRFLGWLPSNSFTLYALQVGSVAELLLLSFALADRINSARRAHSRAKTRALSAKKRLIRTLANSQQVLEQQVTERTRELVEANEKLIEKERHLQHLANHDPLTGLTSRLLLDDRIHHSLRRARRQNQGIGVLLIDLDAFKPVNDCYGHAAGDQVLIEVARRICASVRNVDTVARYGGDEFVVVLEQVFDCEDVQRVVASINHAFDQPFEITGASIRLTASVGMAVFPPDGDTSAALLKAADKSMYGVKNLKKVQNALRQSIPLTLSVQQN